MAGKATVVNLSEAERAELVRITHSRKAERGLCDRARMILLSGQGMSTKDVASRVGVLPSTVSTWRTRYSKLGLLGLADLPRSGKPPRYPEGTESRILAKLDEPPPRGYATWNGKLLSKALGDVSSAHVWRVLRKRSVSLARKRSWCVSTDPEFAAKAADVVGLYLAPPVNALVLSVDEKPGIQALDRAQGWLKMPDGKAITGFSHEYKRNGTINLYAALDVATGLVKAGHFKQKRKVDFMAFMDEVLKEVPQEQEVHVILDNLSSHKRLDPGWLAKYPRLQFHFTPTHASWLNQVETWFSILWRGALKGGSFKTVKQLCQAMDDFIQAYNQNAHPFHWTRATTTPKSLSHSLANL
jgi:transposase